MNKISVSQKGTEEFHKNQIIDFLNSVYYRNNYYINTKHNIDLVILHNGKDAKTLVGVLMELKKLSEKREMIRKDKFNTKAFQELLLYYLREHINEKNVELRHLIVTNIYEWFVFNVQDFEELKQDKDLVDNFKQFEEGRLSFGKGKK